MDDLISRQAAIDGKISIQRTNGVEVYSDEAVPVEYLMMLPSAHPEAKPIDYCDCANAMLKMWMDDVVTDGEYYRIMDKLNKHELERRNNG